jgi:hypothetical protein
VWFAPTVASSSLSNEARRCQTPGGRAAFPAGYLSRAHATAAAVAVLVAVAEKRKRSYGVVGRYDLDSNQRRTVLIDRPQTLKAATVRGSNPSALTTTATGSVINCRVIGAVGNVMGKLFHKLSRLMRGVAAESAFGGTKSARQRMTGYARAASVGLLYLRPACGVRDRLPGRSVRRRAEPEAIGLNSFVSAAIVSPTAHDAKMWP